MVLIKDKFHCVLLDRLNLVDICLVVVILIMVHLAPALQH